MRESHHTSWRVLIFTLEGAAQASGLPFPPQVEPLQFPLVFRLDAPRASLLSALVVVCLSQMLGSVKQTIQLLSLAPFPPLVRPTQGKAAPGLIGTACLRYS